MKEKVTKLMKKICTKEVIMYLIFGVLTTVVSLIVYYGLIFTLLNPENAIQLQIANILSWIAGVAFAYITNRKFVECVIRDMFVILEGNKPSFFIY